jgi:predicted nucleic acid-binding protein
VSVFIDTSVWFAAANIRDRHNARAKKVLTSITGLVLTDHVLVETWGLINNKLHRDAAEQFWKRIRAGIAALEKVTPADLEAAWAIGETFADQQFSIVDRTSFAVMERLGLTEAASFDYDFAIYRYGRNRDRAFRILK